MQGSAVVREDGVRGAVVADGKEGRYVVDFADSSRVLVTADELIKQADGTYLLQPRSLATEEHVIPVIAEELLIETQRVARGKVRLNKRVETREEKVEVPAVREQVIVEHIPIGEFIADVVPEIREDHGVLIIPVIEEVTVIEKRLFLREEVHVSRRRNTTKTSQTISLRREIVDVEREEFDATEVPETKKKES